MVAVLHCSPKSCGISSGKDVGKDGLMREM
jgi:hypothetical protein